MPLIKVLTSATEVKNANELLNELSKELSSSTGKPEAYVMAILQTSVPMTFGGTDLPCCYVEVKSIGSLKPSHMSDLFCKLIEKKTGSGV